MIYALIIGLIVTELASGITGFIFWKKIKNSYWKWFPAYLVLLSIVEIIAFLSAFVFDNMELNRDLFVYFGIPLQFLFFCWLFRQYFSGSREARWTIWGMGLYVLSWLIERLLLKESVGWFTSFSYTIGNIILLVFIIRFFIRFINSDEILHYRNSMMFWVCLGLLAFYLGTFPYYALRNTLVDYYKQIYIVYFYVNLGLDYLMYILFIIAFIWGRPK